MWLQGLSLFAAFVAWAPGDRAYAAPSVAAPTWTDAGGKPLAKPWPVASQWAWNRASAALPVKSPVLRNYVQVPANFSFVTSPGIAAFKIKEGTPTPIAPQPGTQFFVLDVTASVSRASFRDPSGASYVLTLRAPPGEPKLWLDNSCRQLGLGLNKAVQQPYSGFLFLFSACVANGESIDLYFVYSGDAKVGGANIPGKQKDGRNFAHYRFKRSALAGIKGPRLGLLRLVGTAPGSKASDYALEVSSASLASKKKGKPSRWGFSVGLAPSYLKYKETPLNVDLTEIALTGKFNWSFQIVPGTLDIGGNVFGTILPLTYNPQTLAVSGVETPISPARFYGVNGRVGYQLPLGKPRFSMKFLTGWYFWGMLVPTSASTVAYGIKSLNGPQVFITLGFTTESGGAYGMYLKYAPIGGFGFATNRELAIGGSALLFFLGTSPVSLSLDVADAKFTAANGAASMGLLSSSLGLNLAF